jgi:hypothetical protein
MLQQLTEQVCHQIIFIEISIRLTKVDFIFLVPVPLSQPPLDPRVQGHKRKIIAYDDL